MSEASELSAYVTALEAAFTQARGREQVLSPHDFALARAWHAAGIPLALVVDEMARGGRRANSLAYLRRGVEARAKLSATAGATAPARTAPTVSPGRADLELGLDWLARLRAWLAAPERSAAFDDVAARASALDARQVDAPPSPEELRASLGDLDEALTQAALRVCGPGQVARFRQEAARSVARQRGRLDDAALEDALRRYERRRARETLGLPERG